MITVYILKQVGLLETLAFRYSDGSRRWGFEDTFDWGKEQGPWK